MSDAITGGADGALMKDTAANDLIGAVRAICAGERIIPDRLMRQAEEDSIDLMYARLGVPYRAHQSNTRGDGRHLYLPAKHKKHINY